MGPLAAYSRDYPQARGRLLEAAQRLGWSIESFPIGVVGPSGEELAMDALCSPGEPTDTAIVLSSGVHGVEGYFGSAVQLALLQQWPQRSLPNMRYIVLHAVNPYGFAWDRRTDQNNVDLNRNFLLDGENYSHSPKGYAELDTLLNPKRPPSKWEPFWIRALWNVAKHGMPALMKAIGSGQYEFSQGLFFGGFGPSPIRSLLDEYLRRSLLGTRNVVHLDFHTGLGRMGQDKLLIEYPLTESQTQHLKSWFGPDSFHAYDSSKVAYRARGGFGSWCAAQAFASDYLFACAEFGTYSPIRMVAGLRAENQAYHWEKPSPAKSHWSKQQLRELFCPSHSSWRTKVLERGIQMVCQAAHGLRDLPKTV